MSGGAMVIQGDTRALPLADESVDLIVTSPSYFSQRSYKDGGEHYAGQIGDEEHPQLYLDSLYAALSAAWRVLKPGGSAFVNLGDKRSGSGAPGTTSGLTGRRSSGRAVGYPRRVQGERTGMHTDGGTRAYTKGAFGRDKSKQLLPQRFAIGCEDGLADPDGIGWIVREEIIWSKPNGMPESVRDRCRDSHEAWWHLTKSPDYYSALDELREPLAAGTAERYAAGYGDRSKMNDARIASHVDLGGDWTVNPLGKLPGSVWTISTDPLFVPAHLEIEHFAAFPAEWPRRLILAFSPPAICLECGQGRVPVVDLEREPWLGDPETQRKRTPQSGGTRQWRSATAQIVGYACPCAPSEMRERPTLGLDTSRAQARRAMELAQEHGLTDAHFAAIRAVGAMTDTASRAEVQAGTLEGATGETRRLADEAKQALGSYFREFAVSHSAPRRVYNVAGWTAPPSRPAVVLDLFGGSGTTAMVARALGRLGVSVDLSWDYSRLARWRIFESGHGRKAIERTNRERQGTLL